MAEKRVIEYEAASELANDDWLLIDGVTEGTRKARPNVVTAELGAQVTNLASTVGGLTQVAMCHEQSFAPGYDESASYDVGDLVMQYNCLYKCTAPTTGTWDAGKWARTEVSEQLEESGKIDDVQVNGVSVVTDKVANIDLTDMQDDIDSKVADVTVADQSILDENHVLKMDSLLTKADLPTGAISTIEDGTALPMPSLKVGIEAVQSGSGEPSPTNIRPISGWSNVNVTRCGKNLFDKTKATVGKFITSQGVEATNNQMAHSDYIKVKSNTTYYTNADATGMFYTIALYDKNKNFMNVITVASPTSFNTSTASYVIINTTLTKTSIDDMYVIEGSEATDYEPYAGTTYTTQLKDSQGNPLTCYGGELSNENGVQSLGNGKVKKTFNGTESWVSWASVTASDFVGFSVGGLTGVKGGRLTVMCNQLKSVDGLLTDNNCYIANGILYVCISKTVIGGDTVADFKTYLASNNLEIIYPLATPQTIPQDNLAISSSAGINNIWADTGDIQSGEYYRNVGVTLTDLISRVEALENA